MAVRKVLSIVGFFAERCIYRVLTLKQCKEVAVCKPYQFNNRVLALKGVYINGECLFFVKFCLFLYNE